KHDPAIPTIEAKTAELRPQPRTDSGTAIDAGPLKRRASAEPDGCDCGEDFSCKRMNVDVALVLVVGANDFFRRMFIRVRREELHDQAGCRKGEHETGDNRP